MGVCEGGGFSERSSATSIGAACGRLFRLRKTAMLSRHWRLWLSFPSLRSLPKSNGNWARYAREAASLREAPPSRSLPKSGWRLRWLLLHSWFRLKVRSFFDKLGCGHGG